MPYHAVNEKRNQEADRIPDKQDNEQILDEASNDNQEFPETGKVSLVKNITYKVSVSIESFLWRVLSILSAFHMGARTKHIRADFLESSWQDSVRKHKVSEVRSASDRKLNVNKSYETSPRYL